ncbi:MAG: hypothetical protein JKX92_01575 [Porticoccaceae bacterium]|nr:hypothetical protein [Porticoccaceae bacterium]
MKRSTYITQLAMILTVGLLLIPTAHAIDINVSGFIRQEMAYSISNDQNPMNRGTAIVSGTVPNTTGAPSFIKKDFDYDNDWNLMATRAEVNFSITINEDVKAFIKVRGFYSADVFNDVSIKSGAKDVNQFKVDHHGKCATIFEVCDDDFMIDLPSAYIDYSLGDFWFRIGNQQIAWGEAIFFRVMDAPNGLDLRRHTFLDLASEEYADERISAPGIRFSYNFNNNWEIETFAQLFQASVPPQTGSSYSIINSPFHIRNDLGFDKVDKQINAGIRLLAQFDELGLQFMAVSRHNPDPILVLAPGGQTALNPAFAPFGNFSDQPFRSTSFPGAIGAPNSGVYGSLDWISTAHLLGINGVEAVNVLGREFPFIGNFMQFALGLNGPDYVNSVAEASFVLDNFFTAIGDLEADVIPVYASENVFGFSANYIFYSEPDTWLDQLVVRFELTYTPDKKFTNNNSRHFIVEDEWVTGLVFEKYQRFSHAFPATFLAFQWMHKSESDLAGRHLRHLGGTSTRAPSGGEESHGWDAISFAVQQPLPGLIWKLDMIMLYDFNGSYLIQPGVRYKPNKNWTIESFASFLDSKDNAGALQPLAWADEVSLRLTYQF